MDKYIEDFGKLQSIAESIGLDRSIPFPQIVVVGGQSDGKSSVLESIAGHSFLPRGQNTVTRTPIRVVMRNTRLLHGNAGLQQITVSYETDQDDERGLKKIYRKQMDDFTEVAAEIRTATDRLTGGKDGAVVAKLITVEVLSPTVPNLTLIDLPGRIERIAANERMHQEIEDLVMGYIRNPKAIILAVHQASNDLGVSRGIGAANWVDPEGLRTICVLTKLDLVDNADNISERLGGRAGGDAIKCLRTVGVINTPLPQLPSQSEEELRKIQDAEEQKFFNQPRYRDLKELHGTRNLVDYLSTVFVEHLKGSLPQLRKDLDAVRVIYEERLEKLGTIDFSRYAYKGNPNSTGEFEYVVGAIEKFCTSFIESINGRIDLGHGRLRGGVRVEQLFNSLYWDNLDYIYPLSDITKAEAWNIIKNAGGITPQIFLNPVAFETLVRREIEAMRAESQSCVILAHSEVLLISQEAADDSIKDVKIKYPALFQAIVDDVADFLTEKLKKTKKMVSHGIDMHLDYINVKNRHFQAALEEVKATRPLLTRPESGHALLTTPDPKGIDGLPMGLTSEEEEECDLYVALVRRYFSITRDTVRDTIPKIIVRFMVKKIERKIRNRLMAHLGDKEVYSSLLAESEHVAANRREAQARLENYELAVQLAKDLAIA
ncbi:Dynamin-1-like protein [Hypsibius exemplaris]|uniref:Dynamin-1-like protein n=1 Tax=Hypsibius exemplaris TaxID=2072580 RepID=A0A9X6RN04_HYPEX|nr:Dynamin-1-like protein [Hypsibius exemplaris]